MFAMHVNLSYDFSGLGFSVAKQACIIMGMGTANEQMAVRAQQAQMS
jgi:hypothetical protein